MVTKYKSKRTSTKERKDQKRVELHNNEQIKQLLKCYGLSLVDEMNPIFGAGHQIELEVYQDGSGQKKRMALPTLDNISQHLGLVTNQGFDEILALDIPDKYRNLLLEETARKAKSDLSKYLTKVRPFLLERNIYLYTIPLSRVETVAETGEFTRARSIRTLSALPLSTEVARGYGYSEEEIKALAPQVAWLIPQLVVYGKVKNADKLIVALDGWRNLLTPQQNEQLHTSVQKHDRRVINKHVNQLLLF